MTSGLRRLINEGAIGIGTALGNRATKQRGVTAVIVEEGIKIGDRIFQSPSSAAKAVAGYSVNGWSYWRILPGGETLGELRRKRSD